MAFISFANFKARQLDKIQLYGQKGFNRSLFCALGAALLMQEGTYGLAIYPVARVFWDWWFFSYRGYKESGQVSEAFLEWKKMTRDQIDQYVKIMLTAKRILLAIALAWAVFESFKEPQLFMSDLFIMYATLMTLFWGPMLCFRILKSPYANFVWGAPQEPEQYNPYKDSITDLCDPKNPMGYFNPSSINYTSK
ncbi:hypothetical protein [Candidatus Odyssella thessalonicensis]|uniref:hypothetical protein n=1 Tax=Candidatus Odyssella thessalonicensis TaxID=84647 RepID=UPI000C1B85BA|nr:hypothetical protein [Candidatus Odyssella thessalonicensis]